MAALDFHPQLRPNFFSKIYRFFPKQGALGVNSRWISWKSRNVLSLNTKMLVPSHSMIISGATLGMNKKCMNDITTPPDSPMLLSRSFVTRLLRVKRFKALTRAPPQARSKSLPPTESQKNAINYPKAFPTALRSTCQSSIADHCSMKASGVFEDNHKTINSKQKNISTNS